MTTPPRDAWQPRPIVLFSLSLPPQRRLVLRSEGHPARSLRPVRIPGPALFNFVVRLSVAQAFLPVPQVTTTRPAMLGKPAQSFLRIRRRFSYRRHLAGSLEFLASGPFFSRARHAVPARATRTKCAIGPLCRYPRFAFTSAIRITNRFPNARAARVIVSSVTDTFRGSSKRSSCDRLVRSSLAIARFVCCCRRLTLTQLSTTVRSYTHI